MAKELKTISARVPIEYYNKIVERCRTLNMTISDFVMAACKTSEEANQIVDSNNFDLEKRKQAGRPKKMDATYGILMF